MEAMSESATLDHWILAWKRAGWTTPPLVKAHKVLVYEVENRHDKIIVYYYVDSSRRLAKVFISVT
ncbi:MAG: hypothetical protein Q7T82_11615 [Armatimonadota bacterium]|nr:hypothetical protein [Armatimonadota bacterium]